MRNAPVFGYNRGMKYFSLLISLFSLCVFSCVHDSDVKLGTVKTGISFSESAEWNYSQDNDVFVVEADVGRLAVTGDLGGRTLCLARVNSSSADIDGDYQKFIRNTTSRSLWGGSAEVGEKARLTDLPQPRFRHYHPAFDASLPLLSSGRAISGLAGSEKTAVEALSYEIMKTKKSLSVVTYGNLASESYEKKEALLYAFNDVCNVWVVTDDNYIDTDDKRLEVARKFADVFESFYPVIRNVYGKESDKIYGFYSSKSDEFSLREMAAFCDTGTKVNIVLYDLFGDGEKGDVLGFFNPADYYPSAERLAAMTSYSYREIDPRTYSNEGKYFYMDSYFATSELNMIISTLAHEFQHMVLFGVKTMKGINVDTNMNEMLSMLCEDMIQSFLALKGYEISDKDSPRGRLLQFMCSYFLKGIRSYDADDNTALCYANAYAFGAWLCRQWGGAALIKEMMSNEKANNDCIVAAVNSLNGKAFTFKELFGQFIKACYGSDATFTFNRNAEQSLLYSDGEVTYSYPMTAIDLWEKNSIYDLKISELSNSGTWAEYLENLSSYDDGWGNALEYDYDFLGPAVFSSDAYATVRAHYGVFLTRRSLRIPGGTTSLDLTFSTSSGMTKKGMLLYIYIK